ncbi:rhodanese-like domain-containing protein [Desulfovibrio sp. JC010]|uniref:rhodanese-like domain-containing protein n=1 Tax=Desulfovibrio sp. JC010 TaxID=2593641 RepID=UPI0013D709E3|nr:rhodanese-like domain-containing protein [Desulfovibrio sp. JC010]NDV25072.1 rhodanese-like domain-containing protein [Desulfovibrio sp. JC010]
MDSILAEMDFETLAHGEFTASPAALQTMIDKEKVLILDVRTDVEAMHCEYPFAIRIPLQHLPDRVGELPEDKMIITLAASPFQAAVGFLFLRQSGFEEVKTLVAGTEQLASILKPAPLLMNQFPKLDVMSKR